VHLVGFIIGIFTSKRELVFSYSQNMMINIWIINILTKHIAQNPCSEAKSSSDSQEISYI